MFWRLANYVKHKLPCAVLTIEPDTEHPLRAKGWRQSPNNILLSRTLILVDSYNRRTIGHR